MSEEIIRVTKSHPCPICGRFDWDSYTADGRLAFCMRVPSDRQAKNGAYIHVLRDDTAVRHIPPPPTPPSLQERLFSAPAYMQRLASVPDKYGIDGLACELGVDIAALAKLAPCYDVNMGAWAFPMRDGDGNVTGIRLRYSNGDKRAVKHSKQGLFYDADVTHASEAMICEGPTDAAACITLGYVTVGRPSCSGCHDLLKSLLTRWRVKRIVCIADNDEAKTRPDGSVWYPGREGALAMVKALGMEYKMLMTPTKDIRRWVCEGVSRKSVDERIELLKWRKP